MAKKEVIIVQEKANRRMIYVVIAFAILFVLLIVWVIKTQFIPVMENGCSAYGEGYEETISEHTSASGKIYLEYKCCKKGNTSCITVTVPKEE